MREALEEIGGIRTCSARIGAKTRFGVRSLESERPIALPLAGGRALARWAGRLAAARRAS